MDFLTNKKTGEAFPIGSSGVSSSEFHQKESDVIESGIHAKENDTLFGENINAIEADRVTTGALSDGDFYRNTINPNVKMIAKRMVDNDFSKDYFFNKKSFIDNLGKLAIKTYKREFGDTEEPMIINSDTRMMIGKNIAEKIFNLAREEARIEGSDKRKFLVANKFGYRDEYLQSNENIANAMSSF